MSEAEIWRPIPSLPEYLASSHGRVMRLPSFGPMPKGGERVYGGEPHGGVWSEADQRFVLQFRGRTYKIARLICEAFHGPPPRHKPNCLHGDENSRNNRPENLSWGTQQENLNAPGFLEYCRNRRRAA